MMNNSKGERTVASHAASDGSDFEAGMREYFLYRDLGVKQGTSGGHAAHIIRAIPGKQHDHNWHLHEVDFQMVLVLKGWIVFEYEDIGITRLVEGSSCYQPNRIRHRVLANSDDLEMLEIVSPGEFPTEVVDLA